jgi:zinc protease
MPYSLNKIDNRFIQSFPGPEDFARAQLPNGIVVLCRSNYNSPSVFISGLLQVGSLFEPDDKLGLADFTASALMRGTERHKFQEIYALLESTGASLGIGGSTHSTRFNGKALVEDLDLLLSLLAEALRLPVFPTDHVERLRAQLLTSLAMRSQDTGEMAAQAFDQIVYANHPYSRPEDGFPETIQAIQQADLAAFHRIHYGPRGMILSIVGGVDPSLTIEQVAKVLSDWQNPLQPDLPALPGLSALKKTTRKSISIPGKYQSDIVIGVAGPTRTSPDFLAASLGNNVLGQFGMMGRIGKAVREIAGLAYSVSSNLSGGPGPGPWDIQAGTDPKEVERVFDLILQEIRLFVREPISKEELDDSKSSFIGRLPISMESNAGVASALISIERYQLGLDYYQRFPGLINAVTTEEILKISRDYLDPDRLGIGMAGPGEIGL